MISSDREESSSVDNSEDKVITNMSEFVATGFCGGEGDGTNLTWTLDNEGTLTVSGEGPMEDYSYIYAIPSYASDYDDSVRIRYITIDSGVTTIGYSAFSYCYKVTSVTIGNSVTSINGWAFYYCSSLKSLVIPSSIASIEVGAFSGCSSLNDVYYTGSEEQWQKIVIDTANEPLINATIHYNW